MNRRRTEDVGRRVAPGVKGLADREGEGAARVVAAAAWRETQGEAGGPGAPQSALGAAAGLLLVATPLFPSRHTRS